MFKLIFSPAESYTSLSDHRRARRRRRRWHQTVALAAPATPVGPAWADPVE